MKHRAKLLLLLPIAGLSCGEDSDPSIATVSGAQAEEDCTFVCATLEEGDCTVDQDNCSNDCMAHWTKCEGWDEAVQCIRDQGSHSCTGPTPSPCRGTLNTVLDCASRLIQVYP
jgi:hypothetical protein